MYDSIDRKELLEAEEWNQKGRICQIPRYKSDIRGQVTEVIDAMEQKEAYDYDKKGQSQIKYTDIDTGVSVKGGGYIKKDGVGINGSYSGTSGNMPIELPSGIGVDDFASINWSLSYEKGFANWRQIGEGVISLAAIFAIVVFVADNFIGIGAADDLALIPLLGYVTSRIPALGKMLQNMFPQIALSCVN